jgi:WD40 repeat protein
MNRTLKGVLILGLLFSCDRQLPINPLGENALNGKSASAQTDSASTFARIFTNLYEMDGNSVIKTYDGGYTFIANFEGYRTYLTKIDCYGNIQWDTTYDSYYQYGTCLRQTSDSGFVFCGSVEDGAALVTKLNKDGQTQWRNTNYDLKIGYYLTVSIDNEYVVTGCSQDNRLVVYKLSSNGTLLWLKKFGSTNYFSCGHSIERASDNGFIIAGSYGTATNSSDLYLLKIDAQGNMQWQKTFGGSYKDVGSHAIQTSDGGYIAVGTNGKNQNYTSRQIYLIKVYSNGSYGWIKGYFPSSYSEGKRVRETADHGFALAGMAYGNASLIKVGSTGSYQWRNIFGSALVYIMDFIAEPDGGYVFTGGSFNQDIMEYYASLVKTDAGGNY